MEKSFRFYLATIIARVLMIFVNDSSELAARVAQKIDPQYVSEMDKPTMIVGIWGYLSSQKTTEILKNYFEYEKKAVQTISSKNELIIKCLRNSTFWTQSQLQILLVDIGFSQLEEFAGYLSFDYAVISDLTKEPTGAKKTLQDIRMEILSAFGGDTKLILNGDDPLLCKIGGDDATYFGIDRLEHEKSFENRQRTIVYDDEAKPIEYAFLRYAHIGRDLSFDHQIEYAIVKNTENLTVSEHGISQEYPILIKEGTRGYYAELAAISLLREMGRERELISDTFTHLPPIWSFSLDGVSNQTYYHVNHNHQKERVHTLLEMVTESEKKILLIFDLSDPLTDWIYEVDFTNEDSITYLNTGRYAKEGELAQKLLDVKNIYTIEKKEDIAPWLLEHSFDIIYAFEDTQTFEDLIRMEGVS